MATLLDILFPPFCVSCRKTGEWWCRMCRDRVDAPRVDPDPPDGLDAAVVTGFYHDPILRSAITGLKFFGITCLKPNISSYLRHWLATRGRPLPWAHETSLSVQHVPASPERVRSRGFDQSEFLLSIFSDTVVPSASRVNVLVRRKGLGLAQASLARDELREANAKDIFAVRGGVRVPPSVILVDDVITTGSTMGEAARVLRLAGAERVYGLALALGA